MSTLANVLRAVAADIRASADQLNALDAVAGDGDLGVTFTIAANALHETLAGVDSDLPADVLRTCGTVIAREAPSSAGTLIATGLLRAAKTVSSEEGAAADATLLASALAAALTGIGERGKAELGSKTMLDALAPAVQAVEAAAGEQRSVAEALADAAEAADAGARGTVDMQPKHGRAGWLVERSAGHEDAGARLVAIAFRAAARAVPAVPAAG